MRAIVRLVLFGTLIPAPTAGSAVAQNLPVFQTEAAAHTHSPTDIIVWLNTPSGIYHFKGTRSYGITEHCAYVCKKEAEPAGDRPTRNGQ